MRKLLALGVVLTVLLFSLAGCKSDNTSGQSSSQTGSIEAGSVKTGLAVISSLAKSKDIGTEAGLAQSDSTVVAVTVDSSGKIVKCVIDAVQAKVNFDSQGKITTDLTAMVKTKDELGTDYGMKKSSPIGKEWNEQAAALAAYVEGKTVAQVKGIAISEKGAPTDADLAASVTISIGDYVSAIEKAVKNAKDSGAKTGDKLGLGIVTTLSKSKNAENEDGLAQAYSTYAAVTFDSDSKITSCIIDASQNNVNFTKAGKITTDLSAELKTKNELGDDYGMKGSSPIGKEWNEQADAFAKYVAGKTVDGVKGIAIDEDTVPTGADLKASVTISVGDFITIIEKADANAK